MNALERSVLELLLAGDDPLLAVLRRRLAQAHVARREFTGVGFFTYLHVAPTARRLERRSRLVIGDVHAQISGLEHSAGFLLFVEDGALDNLECFIVDEAWPASPSLRRAYCMRPDGPGTGQLIETEERDIQWATGRARS